MQFGQKQEINLIGRKPTKSLIDKTMPNDTEIQDSNLEEDKTSENDNIDYQKKFQTADAQRLNWRNKAIDKETGKSYKELYEVSKKDKTSNDEGNPPKLGKSDEFLLEKLERMSMRQAGLTHNDDIEFAKSTAKKWNMDIDEVLNDEDFKVKLERQQTARTNVEATSNVRGGGSTTQTKNTPEYWIAKGVPPTATEVPDRKTRATISRAMMKNSKVGKTFYNE